MSLAESLTIALDALRANKLRSFLTMLGVIIGVGSVIAVIAIGQAGQAMVVKEVEGLGSGLVWVQPVFPEGEHDMRRITWLKPEDARAIAQVQGVEAASPWISSTVTVRRGRESMGISIHGVAETYASVRNVRVDRGRFLDHVEVEGSARVAVVGYGVVDKFLSGADPVGQTLYLGGLPYTVVGTLEKATGMFAQDDTSGDNANGRFEIYIPYTTLRRVTGNDNIPVIFLQPSDTKKADEVKDRVADLLRLRHGEGKFRVQSLDQMIGAITKVTNVMTGVVAGIAGIALLVGGIGIMNIMLVSVTERTREIGIRKAMGARRSDLLWQFLIEAVVVSMIGGALGIVLAGGLVLLAAKLIKISAPISLVSVLIALSFSVAVGIIFGVYPASRASRLDPIEALRYE